MARAPNFIGSNSPWGSAISNLGLALFGDPKEQAAIEAAKQERDYRDMQMQGLQQEMDLKRKAAQSREDFFTALTPAATAAAPAAPAAPADPYNGAFAPEPAPAPIETQPLAAPGAYQIASVQTESGGDPTAKTKLPGQTAAGLYGFTDPTWQDMGGTGSAAAATPAEQQMRFGRLTASNAADLQQVLGRQPNDSEVRAAHWFGSGTAAKMLQADPDTPVSAFLDPGTMANNGIAPNSTVGEVMAGIHAKYGTGTSYQQATKGSLADLFGEDPSAPTPAETQVAAAAEPAAGAPAQASAMAAEPGVLGIREWAQQLGPDTLAAYSGMPDGQDKLITAYMKYRDDATKRLTGEGKSENERYIQVIDQGIQSGRTDTVEYAQAYNQLYNQPRWIEKELADHSKVMVQVPGNTAPAGVPKPTYGGQVPAAAGVTTAADTTGAPAAPAEGGGVGVQTKPPKTEGDKTQAADIVLYNIQRVRDRMKSASVPVTGLWSYAKSIPGSAAGDVEALLNTIKGNIGFGQLQQMREASQTGAALGPVSDFENKLLQSVIANLETSQGEAQFNQNLDVVEKVYSTIINKGIKPGEEGALLSAIGRGEATPKADQPPAAPPEQPKPTVPNAQNYVKKVKLQNGGFAYSMDGQTWYDDSGQQVQ